MLIDDHSITYINLQDKSGMKFDSNNSVSEIINYRNNIFEYKNINPNNTKYHVDNINPNESYLSLSKYFESNIIEDYKINFFTVVKDNYSFLLTLYTLNNTLRLSHAILLVDSTNKLKLNFTSTDINTSIH